MSDAFERTKKMIWRERKMGKQKQQWADIGDDLVCEICEETETVYPYCVNCVNRHLELMTPFTPGGSDFSESAKVRVCRLGRVATANAGHGTEQSQHALRCAQSLVECGGSEGVKVTARHFSNLVADQ